MKKLLCFFALIGSVAGYAQQNFIGGTSARGMDMNTIPGGFVTEVKAPIAEVKGSTYLTDEWMLGDIEIVGGTIIKDQWIRYNVKADQLEIRVGSEVKGVFGRNINWFTHVNSDNGVVAKYICGKSYTLNNIKLIGVFQILKEGKNWSLLSKTEVVIKTGTYVPSLDIGEQETEFVKKQRLFYVKSDELKEILSNKKAFLKQFESSDKIASFIKSKKLSLKKKEDLIVLLDFLNSAGL